ncbi:glycoside hydrolase family 25 protein [Mucilaginibacter auburnensis]|uniref:Lysozyme n=1 Tax=Mucilaginibacter auburnensis TaxID=1457233 RepID=A0A2H9VM37_9SPHI|nr:glycoside hydrolase family 25 protein [Mucilaginibacter auburnensis]PJJ79401.1 lysozyme [Mucilaginibacter auburnensis]
MPVKSSKPKPIPKAKPVRKSPVRKKKTSKKSTWWRWPLAGLILIILSPLYYGYVLKFFSATWRWVADIGEPANYRTYQSFGIRIPVKYKIHGIDVSYAQGKINWQQVAAMEEDSVRIKFAFIKATEGLLTVDPYFKRNWREAAKVGIVCGAYHFFRPAKDGAWQARFFLQNVKPESGDLPTVVDIEVLDGVSPQKMRKELQAYVKKMEAVTGVKPIIYTSISFYKDYLDGHFDGYPLWIAHYYQSELKLTEDTNWWFWQHSDKATINGIGHVVDFNAFKGDSLQLQKMLVR